MEVRVEAVKHQCIVGQIVRLQIKQNLEQLRPSSEEQ